MSFVNLCSWQFLTDSCFAIVDDCLVIRFTLDEERVVYLMPVGRGDIKAVIGLLKEQAKVEGHPLRIHGVFPRMDGVVEQGISGAASSIYWTGIILIISIGEKIWPS